MTAFLELLAPESRSGWSRHLACLHNGHHRQTLWFDVDEDSAQHIRTKSLDPFVLGLLPNLLRTGGQVELRGPVSEKLHYYLNHQITALLSAFRSDWHPVRFHADTLTRAAQSADRQRQALTGFSGGVDSFYTLHQHRFFPDHDRFRVSGLLFNDVGSHGDGERSIALRQAREDIAREFAADQGFAVHIVRSNINSLLQDGFLMTHSLRNAAAAALFQDQYAVLLYSSGYAYPDCSLSAQPQSAARIDPFLLPLIGTEKMEFISAGIDSSRTEKTEAIVALDSTRRFLNVCTKDIRNCGRCKKCLRTLLTFEVLGCLPAYGEIFDLAAYQQARAEYISGLRHSVSPLDQEIVALANARHFPLAATPARPFWRRWLSQPR